MAKPTGDICPTKGEIKTNKSAQPTQNISANKTSYRNGRPEYESKSIRSTKQPK